jgi:hypothetical protein
MKNPASCGCSGRGSKSSDQQDAPPTSPTPSTRQADVDAPAGHPRVLARVLDYGGLIAALRARTDFLNVSRSEIDRISGLMPGYTAKLLTVPPMRGLGPISLGAILSALGLALLVVEDADTTHRFTTKLAKRRRPPVVAVGRAGR